MSRCPTRDEGPDVVITCISGIQKRMKLYKKQDDPMVDVLQKSEELKQARAHDIDLLKKAKENKMQYKENLKSHASTMNEEMVKEANAKIAYMFAQNTQQPLTSCP
ncbi:hypothetical protein Tco_1444854 [Tanacetum coccineum]